LVVIANFYGDQIGLTVKLLIELFYLPAYSPELNPDELVWGHVKQKVGRATVFSKDNLKHRVIGALRSLLRTS